MSLLGLERRALDRFLSELVIIKFKTGPSFIRPYYASVRNHSLFLTLIILQKLTEFTALKNIFSFFLFIENL